MCKSIKKSCFVIALSIVFFSFYSDVNALFLVQKASSPSNSVLEEQAKLQKIIAEIDAYDTTTGVSWTEKMPVEIGQPIPGFKAQPYVEYTVKLYSNGKTQPYYVAKKLMPQSRGSWDLKVAAPAPAPAAVPVGQ